MLRKDCWERLFSIDEMVTALNAAELSANEPVVFASKLKSGTNDAICAVCASDGCILVGRESGTVNVYTLPNIALVNKVWPIPRISASSI